MDSAISATTHTHLPDDRTADPEYSATEFVDGKMQWTRSTTTTTGRCISLWSMTSDGTVSRIAQYMSAKSQLPTTLAATSTTRALHFNRARSPDDEEGLVLYDQTGSRFHEKRVSGLLLGGFSPCKTRAIYVNRDPSSDESSKVVLFDSLPATVFPIADRIVGEVVWAARNIFVIRTHDGQAVAYDCKTGLAELCRQPALLEDGPVQLVTTGDPRFVTLSQLPTQPTPLSERRIIPVDSDAGHVVVMGKSSDNWMLEFYSVTDRIQLIRDLKLCTTAELPDPHKTAVYQLPSKEWVLYTHCDMKVDATEKLVRQTFLHLVSAQLTTASLVDRHCVASDVPHDSCLVHSGRLSPFEIGISATFPWTPSREHEHSLRVVDFNSCSTGADEEGKVDEADDGWFG